MSEQISRRSFVRGSVVAGAALSLGASRAAAEAKDARSAGAPTAANTLAKGRIGKLEVSRLLLGGNLLTHYTHSRDLKYVYRLAEHYNTDEKILQTLALAEQHGVDTLSIHTVPRALAVLREHRRRGGKIKWIICPTAPVDKKMVAYGKQVRELVDMGTDAIYLWGVRADALAAQNKADLIAEAVKVAQDHGLPSGVGAHDLRVVQLCEKHKVPADFYIKTFHHHRYPTGPKPEELKGAYSEFPGYWCKDPKETIGVMRQVTKPWIAFKVMAAGAIPPKNAFGYVFNGGADFILAGMFDFEIAEDVEIAKAALAGAKKRQRPWRG